MKRTFLIVFLLFCNYLSAQTIYFDLGASYTVGANWNTVANWSNGIQILNAVDNNGNPTSVSYNCVDSFVMYSTGGDTGLTAYPYNAGIDSFYLDNTNKYAKILIGGLIPGENYNFNFFGSRASSGPRAVNINIGTSSVYLDAAYNKSNVVSLDGITADSSGIVAIEVNLASNSSFGYLGVIEINGQFGEPLIDDNTAVYVSPNGLDTNPGTLLFPVATIAGAAQRAREYKSTMGLPEGGLNVYFRQGVYQVNSKYTFGSADSGQAGKPIIYRSYPGETARLTGAIKLDPNNFTLVTSSDTVWSRISTAARGYVYKMSLSSYNIMYGTPTSNPTELTFNQEIMQLGRWPNTSYVTTVSPTTDTSFTYTGSQPSNWLSAPDAYVSGHFSNGYFSSIVSITSINTVSKKITISENPLDRGILSNKGWYAFNLLEEIDSPGEYYVDKTNKVLYFWPPAALSGSELLLSNTANLIEVSAQYINFKDLIFESSTNRAILVTQTHHVTFDGCTIRNTGANAISFSVVTNSTVKNSNVYDTGTSGLTFSDCGNRINLTDSNVLIANNYIARSGRLKTGMTYTPLAYVFSNNCGITFRNNHFEDALDMGISMSGNNHLVEFNRFQNCSSDSDDMGAIYCAGDWTKLQGCVFRYNEIYNNTSTLIGNYGNHGVHGIYFDYYSSGAYCYGNILHTIGKFAFLSNGGRDIVFSNNIIVNSPKAFYVADTSNSENCSDLLAPLFEVNYNVPGSPWYNNFPQLLEIPSSCSDPTFNNYKPPLHCRIDKSLTWKCPTWTTGVGIPYYTITNNLLNSDPRFIDEANGVFALKDDSPAYSIPGFSRIPWEQIGLLDPNKATRCIPLDSSANQSNSLNLYWGAAFGAASHKVYIGINMSAVAARSIGCYLGQVTNANFMGLSLSEGTTYYWAVDEFDSSGQIIGSGDIWSFTTSGNPSVLGDVDGDNKIDLKDFATLAFNWQMTGCVAPFSCNQTDIDNSGTVDFEDLLYLTENWLYGK